MGSVLLYSWTTVAWLIDSDQVSCAALVACVRSDIWKASFITKAEKSQWTPCQVIEWLGIVWDTIDACVVLRTVFKECRKNILWCPLEN